MKKQLCKYCNKRVEIKPSAIFDGEYYVCYNHGDLLVQVCVVKPNNSNPFSPDVIFFDKTCILYVFGDDEPGMLLMPEEEKYNNIYLPYDELLTPDNFYQKIKLYLTFQ